MTQVLQHDYGKSKVTLVQIRAAIKAVKNERSAVVSGGKQKSVAGKKLSAIRSKKPSK